MSTASRDAVWVVNLNETKEPYIRCSDLRGKGHFGGGGQKTQPIMKYRAYLALGKVIRQLAAVMWSFAASTAVTGCCYQ